jgi:tRNA (guanine-N7-)-methyltransferase
MSTTSADALRRLGPRWLLPMGEEQLDQTKVFGRLSPLILEIGCGMGQSTLVQAAADPETDILAVDVHTPGIGSLLDGAERAGLSNVRAVLGDAVEVLELMVAPGQLRGVRIFFPDPWPKVRHRKRRLIQPELASLVVSRVRPGGFIHCATDDIEYAQQMVEVFAGTEELLNEFGGFAPRPADRPVTKFETRAIAAGRQIADVCVTRRLAP